MLREQYQVILILIGNYLKNSIAVPALPILFFYAFTYLYHHQIVNAHLITSTVNNNKNNF